MIKRQLILKLIFFGVVLASCTAVTTPKPPKTTVVPKQNDLVFVEFFAVG